MEIIIHTTGSAIGKVAVLPTLATMDIDEIWETSTEEVKLNYAQVCASRYGAESGKQFHVSSPREADGVITIKRIR